MTKFTEDDEKTLNRLLERKEKADREAAEAQREKELKAYEAVNDLLDLLPTDQIRSALDKAETATDLPADAMARIQRFRSSFEIDIEGGLRRDRDLLAPPPTQPDEGT